MKLPNSIGHRIVFDQELQDWLNNSAMVFALDVDHRKGCKSVAAILHYSGLEMTHYKTDYLVKDEE